MGKYAPNKIRVDIGSYRHYWRGLAKIGKAQPLYSMVQTPSGERGIGSLKAGDVVFTVDGSQTKVVGIFPQGKLPVYEMTFSDGSKTRCSDEHLWLVRTKKDKRLGKGFSRVLTTKEIMASNYSKFDADKNRHDTKYEIPLFDALDIASREVPLDPYVLGFLLGDGCIVGNTVSFSNVEDDIIKKIEDKILQYDCTAKKNSDYNCSYSIKKSELAYRNPIKSILKELEVDGLYSKEKFIPNIYKYNDESIRLEVLRGLLDTDGSVSQQGQVRFCTSSERLLYDVKWLVHSLGGLATVHVDDREDKKSFYLILRLPDGIVPVTSQKHLVRFGLQKPHLCRSIENIELVGEEDCVCIKVADESELYLTDEFIVTHNTTMFRDLVYAQYGGYQHGLLISTGNETGYKALDNVYPADAPTWDAFVAIIDDLVKAKEENEFKIVAIDTVDELVEIATNKALDLHKQSTGKSAKSINEVFGGYGAGRRWVTKAINQQIIRLERKGYGLVFIGHTRIKDIKETPDTDAYQQLTSNLEVGYDNIFTAKADILATFATKKLVKDGIVGKSERYIWFRSDGYIDCGSRLSGMPDKVLMTPENYLKAFEDGVRSSMLNPATKSEIDKVREAEIEKTMKESDAYIEVEPENISEEELENLKEKIIEYCKFLGGSSNEILMSLLKSYDQSGNPNRIKDGLKLRELYDVLDNMVDKKNSEGEN